MGLHTDIEHIVINFDPLILSDQRLDFYRDFTFKKARESYGLNNMVIYPREERPAGRPTTRRSAIYETLKERGAQFGFVSGN